MSDETMLVGREDEATLIFNQWQQTTEFKALNRLPGQPAIRVYEGSIPSPAAMLHENLSLMEDMNASLVSWGRKPLALSEWHGERGRAAGAHSERLATVALIESGCLPDD